MSVDLDARYGRTRGRERRSKLIAFIFAGFVALVFIAWVVWAGLGGGEDEIQVRDIGFSVNDESHADIKFEISVQEGTPVTCAVQALNESFTIVGWKILEIEPSDRWTTVYNTSLITSERSTTGLVYRCWLE
ncbi:DUF4307 domain-containing protein [Humidisolicoccus flavus]|uniref:DUF4307 domain-containing protein n=1 Tax=Humidisolicoccus flavus TaxID=3111414 RepID=UPI00324C3E4E